jgi:hypothetical protein
MGVTYPRRSKAALWFNVILKQVGSGPQLKSETKHPRKTNNNNETFEV